MTDLPNTAQPDDITYNTTSTPLTFSDARCRHIASLFDDFSTITILCDEVRYTGASVGGTGVEVYFVLTPRDFADESDTSHTINITAAVLPTADDDEVRVRITTVYPSTPDTSIVIPIVHIDQLYDVTAALVTATPVSKDLRVVPTVDTNAASAQTPLIPINRMRSGTRVDTALDANTVIENFKRAYEANMSAFAVPTAFDLELVDDNNVRVTITAAPEATLLPEATLPYSMHVAITYIINLDCDTGTVERSATSHTIATSYTRPTHTYRATMGIFAGASANDVYDYMEQDLRMLIAGPPAALMGTDA